jgi:hypothetical protein
MESKLRERKAYVMDFTHPAQILTDNIVRYRRLIQHETDPEQRAKLQEALARDLEAQSALSRQAPHNA